MANEKKDFNMATVEDLTQIAGMGQETAQNILTYRDESGPLASFDELKDIEGVNDATVEEMKKSFSLGQEEAEDLEAASEGDEPRPEDSGREDEEEEL